jgi:fucose 4-O-acetylase-like acetyltransferase
MKNGRNKTLDVAKGISILFMPLSHLLFFADKNSILVINNDFLTPLKLPLFLLISGYLFNHKPSTEFIKSKMDSLLKPFFSIVLLSIGLFLLTGNSLTESVMSTMNFYYPVWFVIFLFFTLIVLNFIEHTGPFESVHTAWACVISSSFLLLIDTTYLDFSLSRYVHSFLIFLLFVGLGQVVRSANILDKIIHPTTFLCSFLAFLFFIFYQGDNPLRINLWEGRFTPFFPSLLLSISGALFVINVSSYLLRFQRLQRVLTLCGRSSIFILAFHIPLGNHLIYPITNSFFPNNLLTALLGYGMTITLCISLYVLVRQSNYIKYALLPLKTANQPK